MKVVVGVVLVVLAAMALPLLFPPASQSTGDRVDGLPWQIEVFPDGNSRVFGLTLGVSTLADARGRFGPDIKVAIVAAPGETGSLEAYYEDVTAGVVTGKMILTGDVTAEALQAMRERAPKAEYMNSNTRRISLDAADLPTALAAPLRSIAFIPSINLDEQMVLQRFGAPGERLRNSAHSEHFLYAAKGLDLVLDSEGKELLQYVPPRLFARLRDPLSAQAAPR